MVDVNFIYNEKRAVKKEFEYAFLEAKQLLYLKDKIKTPILFEYSNNYLVCEYIYNNTPVNEEKSAKELAKLHSFSEDFFGFFHDTTIGPYLQPNTKSTNWAEFFGEYRLVYMAKKAYDRGLLDITTLKNIDKLTNKLESLLPSKKPSLLHGDVWSGNVLSQDGEIYFIDPAIYFGDNEVELAFIMMFNTFSKRFFDIYNELKPIDKEFFRSRYLLYQLYPYLVHVNIYGSSYLSGVKERLKRFI